MVPQLKQGGGFWDQDYSLKKKIPVKTTECRYLQATGFNLVPLFKLYMVVLNATFSAGDHDVSNRYWDLTMQKRTVAPRATWAAFSYLTFTLDGMWTRRS